MRFSSCILPFIGRRKSSRHCRSLRPDAQHVSASASVSTVLEEKREQGDGRIEVLPKGILKKPDSRGLVEVGKRRVKWMDCSGKELFEIREFEPVDSELEESVDGAEANRLWACVIH